MPRVIFYSDDEFTVRMEASDGPWSISVPNRLWARYRLLSAAWQRLQRELAGLYDEYEEAVVDPAWLAEMRQREREREEAQARTALGALRTLEREYEEWGGEPVLSHQEHEDGSLEVWLPGGETRRYDPGTWELHIPQILGRPMLVRLKATKGEAKED
jgi:hypothetical protein